MTSDFSQLFADKLRDDDIALIFTDSGNFKEAVQGYGGNEAVNFAATMGFQGKEAQVLLLPSKTVKNRAAFVGLGKDNHKTYEFGGKLAQNLPAGNTYHIAAPEAQDPQFLYNIALGWGLQQYRQQDYKSKAQDKYAVLVLPKAVDKKLLHAELQAVFLTRRLINMPANDLNPETLHKEAQKLAKAHKAQFKAIVGDALLQKNFPLIHTVGRASVYAPRLLEINHAPPKAALSLTLVGKGVCFDSGGLDIKPSSGMLMMKKDMGGAANALGLAQLIMQSGLPIRLRVLIAAVENAIAGNAFRPMDIITARNGTSVEIGNTDAEGRLILADSLIYACEKQKPDLLIDFATLTGAARVAVGTEIAAMFANLNDTARDLQTASEDCGDAVWHLPLHTAYRRLLDSALADISSTGGSGYAGAITAALFLKEFVASDVNWVHFDMMGWNLKARPAHPIGGEAMGLRTVYHYLRKRLKEKG